MTSEGLIKEFKAGELAVRIYENRQFMGEAAAKVVAEKMRKVIARKGMVSMVFAAAPSQEEFLAALRSMKNLEWHKVIAFHLDEYVGITSDLPQSFRKFLKDRLFDKVDIGKVYLINGDAEDLKKEAERYSNLLRKYGLDIACVGIGENGHLAFNDPHVADFNDPLMVKVVELDEVCRWQQVHDGCFPSIELVPKKAITLTMPTIFNADFISAVVPASSKAEAVKKTVYGPISTSCPASILRKHKDAILFLDRDSASLL